MSLESRALAVPLAMLLAGSAMAAPPPVPDPVLCACDAAHAADVTRVVPIILYDQSRMRPADVDALLAVANGIWRPYGVRIEIGTGADAVKVVVRDGPTRSAADIGPLVLGRTTFSNGHATPYINLSRPAALEVADGAEARGVRFNERPAMQREEILVRMLGVALAHEIGHYLLDSKEHTTTGLMQIGLSARELASPETLRVKLTPRQQERLCAARAATLHD